MSIYMRHKQLLKRFSYPTVSTDVFYVCGQSNAAQTTPVPNLIPFSTTAGKAYGINYNTGSLVSPFQNGSSATPSWGQSNGWVHFAEDWHTLTGRSSFWLPLAVAGSALVPASIPGADYYWSSSDLTKSLSGGSYVYSAGGETLSRDQLFKLPSTTTFLKNPKFVINKKYVIWVQGEADANSVALGRLTGLDYKNELNSLFTFMKTTYGINYFLIVELGRKGTNTTEINSNESHYSAIRAAQAEVASQRTDTFIASTAPKSTGALTVDGNGHWVSGWDYQADGVHYTSESYRALGKTMARDTFNAGVL